MIEVKMSFTTLSELLEFFGEQRANAMSVEAPVVAQQVEEQAAPKAARQRKTKETAAEPVGKSSGLTTPETSTSSQDAPTTSAESTDQSTVDNSAPASQQADVSVADAQPEHQPEPQAEPAKAEVPPVIVTVETVRAYITERIKQDRAFGTTANTEIASFGVQQLSKVPSDKLGDLLEKLKGV